MLHIEWMMVHDVDVHDSILRVEDDDDAYVA